MKKGTLILLLLLLLVIAGFGWKYWTSQGTVPPTAVTTAPVTAQKCVLADGTIVPDGQSVSAYLSQPLGQTDCGAPQTRTCTAGVLSGDVRHNSLTCTSNSVLPGVFVSPRGEDISITRTASGTLLKARAVGGFKPTPSAPRVNQILFLESSDNGLSWNDKGMIKAYTQQLGKINYTLNNAFITQVQKPGGVGLRLIVAFHLWTSMMEKEKTLSLVHSIETLYSDDEGSTWSPTHQVAQLQYTPADALSSGLWEPFIIRPRKNVNATNPGYLQIYYSEERDHAIVCTKDKPQARKGQDLVMKESFDGGVSWSSAAHLLLRNGQSREGVPTIAELGDGTLELLHEHLRYAACDDPRPQAGLLPALAHSTDGGMTWIDTGPIYYPPSDFARSGWPHIIRLADGRLAARFSTESVAKSGVRQVNILLTTNVPTATLEPVWEKTPHLAMNGDLEWGTIIQAANGDLVVTGSNDEVVPPATNKQFYRVLPLADLSK